MITVPPYFFVIVYLIAWVIYLEVRFSRQSKAMLEIIDSVQLLGRVTKDLIKDKNGA